MLPRLFSWCLSKKKVQNIADVSKGTYIGTKYGNIEQQWRIPKCIYNRDKIGILCIYSIAVKNLTLFIDHNLLFYVHHKLVLYLVKSMLMLHCIYGRAFELMTRIWKFNVAPMFVNESGKKYLPGPNNIVSFYH